MAHHRLHNSVRDALVTFSGCSDSPTLIPSAVTVASYLVAELDVDVHTTSENMFIFHRGCEFVVILGHGSNGWWDIQRGDARYRVWSSGDASETKFGAVERPVCAKLVYPFTFGAWTLHDCDASNHTRGVDTVEGSAYKGRCQPRHHAPKPSADLMDTVRRQPATRYTQH